jgi:hypothetical protein
MPAAEAWVALALCVLGLVLFVALARSGRYQGAGAAVVVSLALVFAVAPVRAASNPTGAAALGIGGATITCTAGAILFYGARDFDIGAMDGVCPTSGTVVCGRNTIRPQYGTHIADQFYGNCYELWPSAEGGGTGGETGGTGTPTAVSLKPFDLSTEDGLAISGAILALWCSAWAIRAVIDTLRDRQDAD